MDAARTRGMSDLGQLGREVERARSSLQYLNGNDLSGGLVGYISTLGPRRVVREALRLICVFQLSASTLVLPTRSTTKTMLGVPTGTLGTLGTLGALGTLETPETLETLETPMVREKFSQP